MTRPVVIKVGGSLFDWPELPRRLENLLDERRAAGQRLLLLAGGGPAADWVRAVDRTFALDDLSAHRLALRSLDFTAHILAALVNGLDVVDEPGAAAQVWTRHRIPVLAPSRFLDEHDSRSAAPLPPSWDVTSDAVAARVSVHLGAAELVLLKSASAPPGTDRSGAARLGLVDPLFPNVSRDLEHVVYVNLRGNAHVSLALA
jgi:aspartokinase-like uncharacterized kinase